MMKISIGTSGYAYKEWKGRFYPAKIASREMLSFYSGRLNTVEINNTFYRMPKESVLTSWAEQVPRDFVFALKAPQVITHLKRLRKVTEKTEYLFRTLSVLGRKLGPVLFQFPKSFRADRPAFEDFLGLIPRERACAFEFRNRSWLDDEILDLLRKRGSSLCIADSDESPANEIIPTGAWGYLRLRRSDYADGDLSEWLERILSQKWEKVFVFFKHEDEAKGPEMAVRFRELADSMVRTINPSTLINAEDCSASLPFAASPSVKTGADRQGYGGTPAFILIVFLLVLSSFLSSLVDCTLMPIVILVPVLIPFPGSPVSLKF